MLRVTKLQASYTKEHPITERFLGNAVRGAVGKKLYALICRLPQIECEKNGECPHLATCVYATCFKPEKVFADEGGSVPAPFTVETYGDSALALTLFGNAADEKETFADVLTQIDNIYGVPVKVNEITELYDRIWEYGPVEPFREVELEFTTPTQIIQNKKPVEDIDFPLFIESLLARISHLTDTYEEEPFEIEYGLVTRKPFIKTETALRQVKVNQYGFRNTGFVGTAKFSGELTKYMPYIDLGTQIHVGKLATRGFGQYRLKFLE